MMINRLNLGLVLALALLHLLNSHVAWLKRLSGYRWQSFGAGISLAYLVGEILPELGRFQLSQDPTWLTARLENLIYDLVLLGLLTFYGLEYLVIASQQRQKAQGSYNQAPASVFWLHIGSFAIYNALFSYLLSHTGQLVSCLLFFVAIALHYLVNDTRLRTHHQAAYDHRGRWLLAGAIVIGWVLAQVSPDRGASIPWIKAFLAGGLLLNILNGELPDQQTSRFWSFATGAAVYSLILAIAQAQ